MASKYKFVVRLPAEQRRELEGLAAKIGRAHV